MDQGQQLENYVRSDDLLRTMYGPAPEATTRPTHTSVNEVEEARAPAPTNIIHSRLPPMVNLAHVSPFSPSLRQRFPVRSMVVVDEEEPSKSPTAPVEVEQPTNRQPPRPEPQSRSPEYAWDMWEQPVLMNVPYPGVPPYPANYYGPKEFARISQRRQQLQQQPDGVVQPENLDKFAYPVEMAPPRRVQPREYHSDVENDYPQPNYTRYASLQRPYDQPSQFQTGTMIPTPRQHHHEPRKRQKCRKHRHHAKPNDNLMPTWQENGPQHPQPLQTPLYSPYYMPQNGYLQQQQPPIPYPTPRTPQQPRQGPIQQGYFPSKPQQMGFPEPLNRTMAPVMEYPQQFYRQQYQQPIGYYDERGMRFEEQQYADVYPPNGDRYYFDQQQPRPRKNSSRQNHHHDCSHRRKSTAEESREWGGNYPQISRINYPRYDPQFSRPLNVEIKNQPDYPQQSVQPKMEPQRLFSRRCERFYDENFDLNRQLIPQRRRSTLVESVHMTPRSCEPAPKPSFFSQSNIKPEPAQTQRQVQPTSIPVQGAPPKSEPDNAPRQIYTSEHVRNLNRRNIRSISADVPSESLKNRYLESVEKVSQAPPSTSTSKISFQLQPAYPQAQSSYVKLMIDKFSKNTDEGKPSNETAIPSYRSNPQSANVQISETDDTVGNEADYSFCSEDIFNN